MGNIDVGSLIADPDFVDPIVIIHRTAQVNSLGENKIKECGISSFGSVQPASGKVLMRLPEAMRVANVMSFWIKGKIVSDGSGQYPDILVFKGSRFAVQTVMDWTNWGDGWCEGTCVREKVAL